MVIGAEDRAECAIRGTVIGCGFALLVGLAAVVVLAVAASLAGS